jgi:hypothetical protein
LGKSKGSRTVGELIVFYTPRKHKPLRKYVPEDMRGKLLKFPEAKKTIAESIYGVLVSDKRRFSDDKV